MTDKMGEMILEQLFKMQEKMLHKEDLKNFATKEDLENFATKEDLKNFATKEDLKNFATKEDLKKLEEKIDTNYATKEDLKKIEAKIDTKFATKDDLEAMTVRIEKKFDSKLDEKFEKQTKEIAQELKDIYSLTESNRIKMAIEFDQKIGQLRKEFITVNKK